MNVKESELVCRSCGAPLDTAKRKGFPGYVAGCCHCNDARVGYGKTEIDAKLAYLAECRGGSR